mgnify:CR=1 FL=1
MRLNLYDQFVVLKLEKLTDEQQKAAIQAVEQQKVAEALEAVAAACRHRQAVASRDLFPVTGFD